MVQEDGLWVMYYSPKQARPQNTPSIGSTAWSSAFMNTWNPSIAQESWKETLGFFSRVEADRVNLNTNEVAHSIRSLVKSKGMDPNDPATLHAAQEMAKSIKIPTLGYGSPTFGYVIQRASELGDKDTLDGLFNHVRRFLNPTTDRGGLYYPRNAKETDAQYNYVQMDAYIGNAAIAYGSLNVPNGQRKMFLNPWTKQHIQEVPYIDNIDLSSDVDFLRGTWEKELDAIVLTMRLWDGLKKTVETRFCNLKSGRYGIYLNGNLIEVKGITGSDKTFSLQVVVDGALTDIVVLKASHPS